MILAVKTDNPSAELYVLNDGKKVDEYMWQADRKLADELLPKIQELLLKNTLEIKDITGVIIFTGEGSFTGLRIGTTVANSLAYSQNVPIVEAQGDDWIQIGLQLLLSTKVNNYVVPKYSSEPNISSSKPKS